MKLTVKIDEINYGDVAVKALPLLQDTGKRYSPAIEKTMTAIAALPERLIREIFDTIPDAQKNDMIAAFAMENKVRLLHMMNSMSYGQGIGIELADYSLNAGLDARRAVWALIVLQMRPFMRPLFLRPNTVL